MTKPLTVPEPELGDRSTEATVTVVWVNLGPKVSMPAFTSLPKLLPNNTTAATKARTTTTAPIRMAFFMS